MITASVKIFDTPSDLAESMASELKKIIDVVILNKNKVSIAISGGNTPMILFQTLGNNYKHKIDWSRVSIFWVDERCVPPESEESNFGMTHKFLLSVINIPEKNIHHIDGENIPFKEAERYAGVLRNNLRLNNNLPQFDIILLGMGDDGHTASIFPDQMYLLNSDNYCEVAMNPYTGQKRITLTGKIINNADRKYFIVTGMNKAKILKEILDKDNDYLKYPASHITEVEGPLKWYLDKDAACLLSSDQK
ncbi:MAG TPA: 6-phosphogluconolactonase [Ignavibacteria bacterium]|nr:6-phosphogluconolactonase [Ignavibacteria bacterium]HMR39557.1 6-phosphogluconolactonase [Ignavibacteria bacterium]